jgi:hypothetical protein
LATDHRTADDPVAEVPRTEAVTRMSAGDTRRFGLWAYGIGAAAPLDAALEGELPPGIEPGEAFQVVAASDLAMFCGRVPLSEFGEDVLETTMSDPSRTAAMAMRHEAVLERLAGGTAVIPLPMGRVFLSEARVRSMLEERAADLERLLRLVDGRDEWSVIVYCDFRRLREVVDERSTRLSALVAEMEAASPGRRYLMRKKLESLRDEESRVLVRETVRRIRGELEQTSVKSTAPDLTFPRPEESPSAVARMALLVDRSAFDRFRTMAEELSGAQASAGFRLELVGPLPGYSFVGGDGPRAETDD